MKSLILLWRTAVVYLALKQAGGDIEHSCLRIFLLDTDADGLNEMGLAYAGRAKHKEGVEGLALRIHGYGLAYGARHAVARAAAIVFKKCSGD